MQVGDKERQSKGKHLIAPKPMIDSARAGKESRSPTPSRS